MSFDVSYPIVSYVMIGVVSLVILAKSVNLMIDALSVYARKIGVSEYVVGFLILAIGTAFPEMAASFVGAMIGESAVIFGTILGSNFFKIFLLGLGFMIARRVKVDLSSIGNAPITTFLACALPILLVLDGELTRFDGVVLLCAYVYYVALLWAGEGELGVVKKNVPLKQLLSGMVVFLGCMVAMLLASRLLVFSVVMISAQANANLFFVSFVVIGIGSSMPEIAVMIGTVLKKKNAFVFGNILGSMVANSLFVLGIVALVSPFALVPSMIYQTSIVYLLSLLIAFFIIERENINWKHGLVLVGIFVLFMLFELYIG